MNPTPGRVYLAPMEGVVDATVRDLWTRVGGYDQVFTEFIRVTNQRIPDHVFFRECPELQLAFERGQKTCTPNGTPLVVQLLGGDANWVTENAVRAIELGSPGIDLNFGCPAPTVNRHDGGAALLQKPERLYEMVSKVRAAVPRELPVTAKMRLGFMDASLCLENARAVSDGGAETLTVHCRTKKQMYQPPVDWSWLPRIRDVVNLNLIVNGDIWTASDAEKCRQISGCQDMMIGRSALSDPWLALKIKGLDTAVVDEWPRQKTLLLELLSASEKTPFVKNPPSFAVARVKQMLRSMALQSPGASAAFNQIKIMKTPVEVREILDEPRVPRLAPDTTKDHIHVF